jgi:hypothetical protein
MYPLTGLFNENPAGVEAIPIDTGKRGGGKFPDFRILFSV